MKGFFQNTEFTCGPACMIAVLQHFFPTLEFDSSDEFAIWREANTVYMGEGNPGTSAYGLALSARARGLQTIIYDSGHAALFLHHQQGHPVHEGEVLSRIVEHDKQAYLKHRGILHTHNATPAEWGKLFAEGYVAIVLVESLDSPILHWVLAHRIEQGVAHVYDPYPYDDEWGPIARQPVMFHKFWQRANHQPLNCHTVLFIKKEK